MMLALKCQRFHCIVQVFVGPGDSGSMDRDEEGDPMENHVFDQRVYVLRKSMSHKLSVMTMQHFVFFVCLI